MKKIVSHALARPPARSSDGVERILAAKCPPTAPIEDFSLLWTLDSYGLEGVSHVMAASPEQQRNLRAALARGRLLEAWQIEKAGMSFAAKMNLLAESLSEQRLYSLFVAEEARHFQLIDGLLGSPEPGPADPFISLLHGMIATAGRRPLQLLIQVVLEGWGIEHYAGMARQCRDPGLKAALSQILADEAAHHGSGLSLFEESQLTPDEQDYAVETLQSFLAMVAIGPVGVLAAIADETGGLSDQQSQQVLTEMDARADTQAKLDLLAGLLRKAGAQRILARLQQAHAFTPTF